MKLQKSKHNIIDVIAYGIKTGASDSEIAEHFGWKTKSTVIRCRCNDKNRV